MNAKFINLQWIPSNGAYLKQRVKGGKRPKGAIKGDNGSFIVCDPAELILTIQTEKGRVISQNIYSLVKEITDRRITKKLRGEIEDYFKNSTFVIEKNRITNIYNLLEEAIE